MNDETKQPTVYEHDAVPDWGAMSPEELEAAQIAAGNFMRDVGDPWIAANVDDDRAEVREIWDELHARV